MSSLPVEDRSRHARRSASEDFGVDWIVRHARRSVRHVLKRPWTRGRQRKTEEKKEKESDGKG